MSHVAAAPAGSPTGGATSTMSPATTATTTRDAVVLRAAAQPTLGDLNLLSWPGEYAALARRLWRFFPIWTPRLGGRFRESAAAIGWRDRFIEPAGWS